jgi:hypothetical protein
MKNTERISKRVLDDIRQNTPFGRDNFTDEEINKKTTHELLDHYLIWNGLIGYGPSIRNAISQIYGVKLEDT